MLFHVISSLVNTIPCKDISSFVYPFADVHMDYFQVLAITRRKHGNPLQYSYLENPMDRGAWWAAVHGVTRSRIQLSNFTFTFHFHALEKEMATHSNILAWRIPGTGEPGGLPSTGSHRVRHDWSDLAAAAAAAAAITNKAAMNTANTCLCTDILSFLLNKCLMVGLYVCSVTQSCPTLCDARAVAC